MPKRVTKLSGVRKLLRLAVDMYGSENRLALAIGTPQQVLNAAIRRRSVSPELAMGIHRATDGWISAHQLRPDLWRQSAHVPVQKSRHGKRSGGKRNANNRTAARTA